jgi:hypothetical protein
MDGKERTEVGYSTVSNFLTCDAEFCQLVKHNRAFETELCGCAVRATDHPMGFFKNLEDMLALRSL